MRIMKQWKGSPDKLKKEGIPIGWFETTEKECLDHTEGSGFYKENTVLTALKKDLLIRTPFAWYKKG